MDALRHHREWSRSPRLVLTDPRSGSVPDWLTDLLAAPAGADLAALAALYRQVERGAHQREDRALRIRALLAEAAIEFERTGVTPVEPLYYVVMQHRLARSSTAAQGWAVALLRRDDVAPLYQARLWRELAALHEVEGSYERGLSCIDTSLTICGQYPDDEAIRTAASQSHLQRSTLLRLSGRYAEARLAIADAQQAAGPAPSRLTRGLISLRTAGLDLVIGHLDDAERGYREAADLFDGVSANNRRYALVRQVTCLRGQGKWEAAAHLGDQLLTEVADDPYRTGQVLLELAEIEIERLNEPGLLHALERSAPLLSQGDSLESLRWRTLLAREAVVFARTDHTTVHRARTALAEVLQIASRHGRDDITRLLMALHTLAQLSAPGAVDSNETSLHATRTAVMAAELQRTVMANTDDRWQMKRTREVVYSLAALLHTQQGRHTDVAVLLELGRADLIEQALGDSPQSLRAAGFTRNPARDLRRQLAESVTLLTDSLTEDRPPTNTPSLPWTTSPSPRFDHSLTIGLVNDETGWTAIRALGSPHSPWDSSTATASTKVSALLTRLIRSSNPDLRGVSNDTWKELGELMIPTELAEHPSGSLLISPDPRLWRLPWPALPHQGRYIVDRGALTLTPSFLTHGALQQRAPASAIGTRFSTSQLDDTLSGSELEREALRQWSRSLEQRPGLLYISGHAAAPETAVGVGELDFDALSRAQLPEIVVLNGCWTGASRPVYGRDPFSLAVGALIGGASHAIAGIGHIGSDASARVGVAVLRYLAEGMEVPSALRQAQIDVRDSHPDAGPMDWGGLISVG